MPLAPMYAVVLGALLTGTLLGCGGEGGSEVEAGAAKTVAGAQERSLPELLDEEDPGWPLVQEWIAAATNPVEVLPTVEEQRGAELLRVQVTTRSPMGAVVYETGGVLVDHGWLRILGSGHPRLPRGLGRWNEEQVGPLDRTGYLLVADDAVGGIFALNGGALPGAPGSVHYFDPRSNTAIDLERSYSEFLVWAFEGDLATFYGDLRWDGWEEEVGGLAGDCAFSFYPFLCAEGPPLPKRFRSTIPIAESLGLFQSLAEFFATGGEHAGK